MIITMISLAEITNTYDNDNNTSMMLLMINTNTYDNDNDRSMT